MAIIYRTTDNAKWGPGKGGDLTPAEVDNNFWELFQAIVDAANNAPQPLEIAEINVVGNQMTIILSDGYTQFGPYTLPTAAFNWTGNFQAAHNYNPYDLLIANDVLYMVLVAHTSGPSFVMGPNYQMLMPIPSVFDVGLFFPQAPGQGIPADAPMFSYLCLRDWFLNVNAPGSLARLRVATTAELVFPIYYNDTAVGNITFGAGQTNGVITMTAQQFTAGDVLRVRRAAIVDATALDLNLTFAGRLGTL